MSVQEFDLRRDLLRAKGKLADLVDEELDHLLEDARVVAFVHDGVPVAWERAGFNRKSGAMFTPKKTRDAEEALAWAFHRARNRRKPFHDSVAIVALFYVPTRRRKDLDNLKKLVLDAGTKSGIWLDDSQVIAQASFIELDARRPRTVIAVCPCLGSLSKAPLLTASGAI
jgi:Holliday junction resolvase RusA-like endonuclease